VPYVVRIAVAAIILVPLQCMSAAHGTASPAAPPGDVKSPQASAAVRGTASYRERIALPPGAVFEATLEDISRADAAAIELGRVVIENPRTPVRFEVAYDPARIAPERTYSVRARILVDGRLWFTSDQIHPVLTRGAGDSVEIVLKDARRSPSAADPGAGGAREPLPAHGLWLPATFRGDLPCVDCAGVHHHLDLWPDQVFHLRREWLGKDVVRGDAGRWRMDPGRRVLILQGGAEMPLQFAIVGPYRLRQLDLAGKPVVSDLPHELTSDGTLQAADVPSFLGGEMTYMAESARFTECLTGRSYAIAPGPEASRLQDAYLAGVRAPGAGLYVTFEGTLTHRPGMDGGQIVPTVTVERFIDTWPSQACERARADASLVNTYWRIAKLRGEAVVFTPGRREPHVVLRQTDQGLSYAATVGCNQLIGSFETTDDRISFKRAATTLMACTPPLDGLERHLTEVLEAARRWQIRGSTLELQDAEGQSIALFEAVYF
jgi:uncharacterized lipoprotein YbaY/heat shock protein HslJ/uncharacterized lipoprotein NlpE involved in copper resistance